MIQKESGYAPTPVISHAILTYNRGRKAGLADGIVITPSHNPPDNGGIKYNPPKGGPADTKTTQWIEEKANNLLKSNNKGIKRIPYEKAIRASTTHIHNYIEPYVTDLKNIIDLDAVRSAGLRTGFLGTDC